MPVGEGARFENWITIGLIVYVIMRASLKTWSVRCVKALAILWLIFFCYNSTEIYADEQEKHCLKCHPGYMEKYSGEVNHYPFETKDCLACHAFHGFQNNLVLKGEIYDLCTNCHEDFLFMDEDYVHYPVVEDSSCVQCHQPHGSAFPKFLRMSIKETCFQCHEELEEGTEGIHPAYSDSTCVFCHDPHGSPFGTFFKMPVGYMCLGCHLEDLPQIDPSELHAARDDASCDRCHNGHQSDHPRLLKQEPEQLCLGCHGQLEEEIKKGPIHSALEEEDCLLCHIPHFGKGSNFLNEDNDLSLCLTCHSEIEEKLEAEYPHPVIEDEGCVLCHNPHLKELNSALPDLCADCHDIEDNDFRDMHARMTPENCVECHDPHGSNRAMMMKPVLHPPFEDNDCEMCHEDGRTIEELRNNEICLDCHEIESDSDENHKEAEIGDKSCVFCHSPHAGQKTGLIRSNLFR